MAQLRCNSEMEKNVNLITSIQEERPETRDGLGPRKLPEDPIFLRLHYVFFSFSLPFSHYSGPKLSNVPVHREIYGNLHNQSTPTSKLHECLGPSFKTRTVDLIRRWVGDSHINWELTDFRFISSLIQMTNCWFILERVGRFIKWFRILRGSSKELII